MNPSKRAVKTPRRDKTPSSSNSGSRERLRDPVQVFCRLRPLKDDEESTCVKVVSPSTLTLCTPSGSRVIRKDLSYQFKHIFTPQADQKEIFDHVAYPLIEDLLHAKNGLLFTYGVTGSGKTYTLAGTLQNPGVMPRCIYTIFNSIDQFQAPKYVIKPDKMNGFEVQSERDAAQDRNTEYKSVSRSNTNLRKGMGDTNIYKNDGTIITGVNENNLYSVFVTYIEIYINTVYDLLEDSTKPLQAKILREDSNKNMYVNGVVELEVKSAVEAFDVFNAGQKRKRMGNTVLNSVSSRSHSIFTIRVVQLEQPNRNDGAIPEGNVLKVGQLSLVDLAGSERCSRTQNRGVLLKEASSINNSLMSLRSCMEILRENQLSGGNKLVSYRDSRLTLFFKNYFEGEGRIQMIICLNPSLQDFEENLQVVKFAELSQDVKVARAEVRYTPYRTRKPVANVTSTTTAKTLAPVTSTMLPEIPTLKLNLQSPEECIAALTRWNKILSARREKTSQLNKEIEDKEKHFRKRLVDMDKENTYLNSEVNTYKRQLGKETRKSKNLEIKLSDLETQSANLLAQQEDLEEVIKTLRFTIDEKDLKINQNFLEKEKTKQKLQKQSEKMTHELDVKLRRQREHLHAAMLAKDSKLQKMRQILDSEMEIPHSAPTEEPMEAEPSYEPQQSPQKEHVHRHAATRSRRRRSRSAGEVWLEHNSVKPVPLGTVLQPAIKKRKSLTKLSKATDVTNPKQNKYCLIAQEPDADGELETKVYKGDILQTCGGGAQVIFNDVERLRQESPTADK